MIERAKCTFFPLPEAGTEEARKPVEDEEEDEGNHEIRRPRAEDEDENGDAKKGGGRLRSEKNSRLAGK